MPVSRGYMRAQHLLLMAHAAPHPYGTLPTKIQRGKKKYASMQLLLNTWLSFPSTKIQRLHVWVPKGGGGPQSTAAMPDWPCHASQYLLKFVPKCFPTFLTDSDHQDVVVAFEPPLGQSPIPWTGASLKAMESNPRAVFWNPHRLPGCGTSFIVICGVSCELGLDSSPHYKLKTAPCVARTTPSIQCFKFFKHVHRAMHSCFGDWRTRDSRHNHISVPQPRPVPVSTS